MDSARDCVGFFHGIPYFLLGADRHGGLSLHMIGIRNELVQMARDPRSLRLSHFTS